MKNFVNLKDYLIVMNGLLDWLWEILFHNYGLFIYSLFRHWIVLIILTILIFFLVNYNSQKQKKPIFWEIMRNVLVICLLTICFFLPFMNAEKFHQIKDLGLRVNNCIEDIKKTNNGIVPKNLNELKEYCLESQTKEFVQYFRYESFTINDNITQSYSLYFYPPNLKHTFYFLTEGDNDFIEMD